MWAGGPGSKLYSQAAIANSRPLHRSRRDGRPVDPASSAPGRDCRLFLHDFQYFGYDLSVNVRILVDVEVTYVRVVGEVDVGDRPFEPAGGHHFLPELMRLVVVDYFGRAFIERSHLADAVEGHDQTDRHAMVGEPPRH